METFSPLLALCAGNSPASGEIPSQRPLTRGFDIFFDLCLKKWLSKQSWGWRFDTPSPFYDVTVITIFVASCYIMIVLPHIHSRQGTQLMFKGHLLWQIPPNCCYIKVPQNTFAIVKYKHKCQAYRKLSNIRRTKSPNLNVSRLVLQLSLLTPMKPAVKSRMKT